MMKFWVFWIMWWVILISCFEKFNVLSVINSSLIILIGFVKCGIWLNIILCCLIKFLIIVIWNWLLVCFGVWISGWIWRSYWYMFLVCKVVMFNLMIYFVVWMIICCVSCVLLFGNCCCCWSVLKEKVRCLMVGCIFWKVCFCVLFLIL